jgi:hypothetical protein
VLAIESVCKRSEQGAQRSGVYVVQRRPAPPSSSVIVHITQYLFLPTDSHCCIAWTDSTAALLTPLASGRSGTVLKLVQGSENSLRWLEDWSIYRCRQLA